MGKEQCICFSIYQSIYLSESESHLVRSNSLRPYGLYSPWTSPGQKNKVGNHSLLQGIFPTQESNPSLLVWQADSLALSHQGKPNYRYNIIWNTLSALIILSALPSNPWQPIVPLLTSWFCSFQNVMYLEHRIESCFRLASCI